MESMQLALENVVITVFDGPTESCGGSSEVQLALCRIFEGILRNFQLFPFKFKSCGVLIYEEC